jgi:restriction system protein
MRRTAVPAIADQYSFSEEIRNSRVKTGQTHIENRTGWAMSALKKAKFISNHPTQKFTYEITQAGKDYLQKHQGPITSEDLSNLDGYMEGWKEASRIKQVVKTSAPISSRISTSTPVESIDNAVDAVEENLRAELQEQLSTVDPFRFEQVVIDLLFSMGYGGSREEAAQITKKSNDEGIDGIINEDRLGLDVIYIQAKRWQHNIGRKEKQSFVGALAGKQANKGVYITTSDFAHTAIDYADSVSQKVILINGDRLADLMIEHNIGVSTVRTIELKRLDSDYFGD